MKKSLLIAVVLLTTSVFADSNVVHNSINCQMTSGNSVQGSESKKTETRISKESTVMRFENGILVGTVQFKHDRIIQMMIENTKNYTFTQLNPMKIIEENKGYVFLQDIMNDGQFMEISCELNNK